MPAFKEPGFQDRVASAARAKDKALAQLRAKPEPDQALMAERAAARAAREAAQAEKREAARLAKEEAAAERARLAEIAAQEKAAAAAAAAAIAAPEQPVLTEAERKAARDARYAARKNRKR